MKTEIERTKNLSSKAIRTAVDIAFGEIRKQSGNSFGFGFKVKNRTSPRIECGEFLTSDVFGMYGDNYPKMFSGIIYFDNRKLTDVKSFETRAI